MRRWLHAAGRAAFRWQARPAWNPAAARKVLLVKTCCVGDILFTSPAVRAVRRALPQAELCYLVGGWSRAMADGNPHVDRVIEFPERGGAPALARLLWRLRHERFDLAVNFHRSALSHLLLRAAGIPVRAGFDWEGSGFALTHPARFDPALHEVRRYFAVLDALGLPAAGETTELAASQGQRETGAQVLRAAGLDPAGRIAAVFPGGGRNPGTVLLAKRWTTAGFNRLAVWLARERGFQIAVIGGPGDEGLAEAVLAGVPGPAASLVGRTTLPSLAGVLAHAAWCVGGDSGPVHMAAALGVPTFMLFGPSDPRLVAPPGDRHATVWRHIWCSPCYVPETLPIRNYRNCRTWECLQELAPETVLTEAAKHLDRLGLTHSAAAA